MSAPAALPLLTDTTLVNQRLSDYGVRLRVDDDGNGSLSTAEQASRTECLTVGSETVYSYLYDRYDPAAVRQVRLAWAWASDFACYELCRRRGNPVPENLIEHLERVEERLDRIRQGKENLMGCARRAYPVSVSNVRTVPVYNWRVVRVMRNLSSPLNTPQAPGPQTGTDWASAYSYEI